MTMTASSTVIMVDLKDAEGYPTGRSVPVQLDYVVTVEQAYGEDADGRQGMPRVEYAVLDQFIDLADLVTLNSMEVEQALAEAAAIFHQRPKHW